MKEQDERVELVYNGNVIGVFSNSEKAEKFMERKYPNTSYSILPIGTLLHTDTK